jgi:hypothetical protein
MVVGRIKPGMNLYIDPRTGEWLAQVRFDLYYPLYFWMDIAGFRESGGWPLAHLLIPRRPYAAGIDYQIPFTGVDPKLPEVVKKIGFWTRGGHGQLY